jgi:hypothetical protein
MTTPTVPTATTDVHLAHYIAVLHTCKAWRISVKTLLLLLRIARKGDKGLSTANLTPSQRISMRLNRPWDRHGIQLREDHGPKPRGPQSWRRYYTPPAFLDRLCPLSALDHSLAMTTPPLGPAQAHTLLHRLQALTATGLTGCHLSTIIHAARPHGLLRSRQCAENLPWSRADEMRGSAMIPTLNELLKLGIITATVHASAIGTNLHLITQPAVRDWLLDVSLPWPVLIPQLPLPTTKTPKPIHLLP